MNGKLVGTIREAAKLCGLRDGMTVSFHHHLRNGDHLLNTVMETLAGLGLRDLTISSSSIHDVHAPVAGLIEAGVVTGLDTNYIAAPVGRIVSAGKLPRPALLRTHGGRPAALATGESHIDVAFIAAPAADCMGNLNGVSGPSACGSLGYAFADARYADKVVVVTDHLEPYPLIPASIDETLVDYVVRVDSIGDPAGIVSGTTRITRDPVGLAMAKYAARVIEHSGLLKDGFSFQTGAGGASLAVTQYLKQIMREKQVTGSFALGGITGYIVDLLEEGYFRSIQDVQCFDLRAVESLRSNPNHREISAACYASPTAKSCAVGALDAVILGATEIDVDFNVNVHTDSNGVLMGGSGGHGDTAAGAKLAIVVAPLTRARLPVVREKVLCTSTPGRDIDVLVTQRGIAVNPKSPRGEDLRQRLLDAKLPVIDIRALAETAIRLTGQPKEITFADRVVANIYARENTLLDTLRAVNG